MSDFISAEQRLAARQQATLMEMWYSLDPTGRLETIAALTGDAAVREFLAGLATSQSEEEKALDKLRAQSKAQNLIHPKHLPTDAGVMFCLTETGRVSACESDEEVTALPYDRLLITRYLGDSTFKILGEENSDGLEVGDDEDFDINDVVQVGTARISRKRRGDRTFIDGACRYDESLGIKVDDRAMLLTGFNAADEQLHLVLSHMLVNGETVLPYLGE